jgi:hypothetical protein
MSNGPSLMSMLFIQSQGLLSTHIQYGDSLKVEKNT